MDGPWVPGTSPWLQRPLAMSWALSLQNAHTFFFGVMISRADCDRVCLLASVRGLLAP